MAGKGRPIIDGKPHTWVIPHDIVFIKEEKGIAYLWECVRTMYKIEKASVF